MARKATLIYRDWLTSVTLNNADDMTECIALRLLLAADDYGRLTYRSTSRSTTCPTTLKIVLNDFRHTPEQIQQVIDYLVAEGCLESYIVESQEYIRWVKWEDYQTIKWRDDARYPAPDGKLEVSTNPQTIAKRAANRTVKRRVKRHVKRTVQQEEVEVQEEDKKKKKESSPDGASKFNQVTVFTDMYRELFDPTFKPHGPVIGQIQKVFKHLDENQDEFRKRIRHWLGDEWVRENRPPVSHLYNNIEKYKNPVVVNSGKFKGFS